MSPYQTAAKRFLDGAGARPPNVGLILGSGLSAVAEGVKFAAEFCDSELAVSIAEGLAGVKANGMEVIEINKDPFIEIAKGVWEKMEAEDQWDAGMMAQIQAQLDEYRN